MTRAALQLPLDEWTEPIFYVNAQGQNVGFFQKENINRALPHLWLSGENWSDGSVGRTQGTAFLARSQPIGRF